MEQYPTDINRILGLAFPGLEIQKEASLIKNRDLIELGRIVPIRNQNNLRWLISTDPKHCHQLLKEWQPFTVSKKIFWKFFSLGLYIYLSLPHKRPIGYNICMPSNFQWQNFGWHNDTPPSFSIHVGKKGPTQKLILFIGEPDSKAIKTITKIGIGKNAYKRQQHENQILIKLSKFKRFEGFIPTIKILDNCAENFPVTTQNFIKGKPSNKILDSKHINFLCKLKLDDEQMSLLNFKIELACKITNNHTIHKKIKKLLLSTLEGISCDLQIPKVISHGDFAPWNLKIIDGGKIAAIDWEYACLESFPMLDIFHFFAVQNESSNLSPKDIVKKILIKVKSNQISNYCRFFGIPTGVLFELLQLYLVDFYLRKAIDFPKKEGPYMIYLRKLMAVARKG
jgi:thiamine kinase-like enzyme